MKALGNKLVLITLLILLVLVALYAFKPSNNPPQKKPLLSMQKQVKTLPSFKIKNAKLPLPKIFNSGSFSGTLTYQNAILIAREYYDKKEYQDALVWAQRADSVSYLDSEAWMLYALCLHKLGYKLEAYATLKAYQILRASK